ncbi:hypothetical protein ACFX2I_020371 [Malus domestica]
MTMPSGNVVLSDKMQFPSGGGGAAVGGGEIHQHPRQWLPDERDGFISWLRGEFAAANTIIDSLCHHLRAVGDPGEYDVVIGCIQQRRCNWNPVLHMQQYFSVAEVIYALQHVAWRRQHMQYDPVKVGTKEYKRSASGFNKDQQRAEHFKEGHNFRTEVHSYDGNSSGLVASEKVERGSDVAEEVKPHGEVGKLDDKGLAPAGEKKDALTKPQEDSRLRSSGNSQQTIYCNLEPEVAVGDGCTSISKENESHSIQIQIAQQNLPVVPKTFVGNELIDGKTVNVVDGLKLFEGLLGDTEVSKLVSLANDLRVAGKRGQFQGEFNNPLYKKLVVDSSQTYVVSKRPMRGHGREMIQLGLPVTDAPSEDEISAGTSKGMLQITLDVIDRLVGMQVTTVKPDSCIIDFYNEGDHSHPHIWPPWFGRPVCVLLLTECDMTFGRVLVSDHPGDYRGALKLSLTPGSLLLLQGKSTDFAKHAIPSIRKQRILVTFTKSQPKKSTMSDGQRFPGPTPAQSSHWGPASGRSPSHIRHPAGPNHYAAVPTTGVLPAPSIRSQLPPPNGIQPLFVPAPVGPAIPFATAVPMPPVSAGWAAAPRHPPPRIPLPGTGVFLPPPGSGNSSAPQQLPYSATQKSPAVEIPPQIEKESGSAKSNHSPMPSPRGKSDGKAERHECNGSADGTGSGRAVVEEEDQNSDSMTASNQAGAV